MTNLKGTYHNKGLNIYVTLANSGPTQKLDFDGENLTLSDGGGSVQLVERKVFTPEAGFSGSIEQTEILGLPYGEKSGAIYMELESVVQALNTLYYAEPDPYSSPPPGGWPDPPEPVDFLLFDTPAEGQGVTFELFKSPEELANFWTALIEADTLPEVKASIQWRIYWAASFFAQINSQINLTFDILNEGAEIYVKDGKTWLKLAREVYETIISCPIKITSLKDAVPPEEPPAPGPPIPL